MAAGVQELAARLGLATGHGLATLIRRRFPQWVLYGSLLLTLAANTFNIAADVGSMAASSQLIVDVPQPVLVVLLTGLMLALELTLRYHQYARVLRWLTLSLGAYVVVLALVDVDWHAVVQSLLSPGISARDGTLAALIAIFGTTVSPYLFFWQASEEVEEEHELLSRGLEPEVGDEHFLAMRIDVIGGMVSAVLVAFIIVIVAASTLHRSGVTTVTTAEEAAAALQPLAGDLAGALFALGIVGLGLLAVPVLAGSSAYALSEAFGWQEGLARSLRQARGFYLVLIGSMLSGMVIDFVGLDPIRALYYAAILNGLVAPPLIVLMFVLGRDRQLLGEHCSGIVSTLVVSTTIAISVSLPILYLVA
jgi:Mn2+/Fe2+ NRAMP family transporter